MSALSRPLASISSDPLEGLKVTAANRFKNILLGSFDPSSLPYAFLKSQIDDQAVRATAAGAFNRKWEIATPTQRSFARAASYEDELAQRTAELASYKFNPTPPRGGGGGGKTAVNLGENLGGSGNLSGGGLTPQTAQSVKAALNPQTQTPQAAQTAQNIKQALNAQTPQPQPTLSPNLQKPNLINTIEAQPALKTPSVKMNAKTANEIDNVPLTSQKEFNEFVDQVLSKDYQNAPNIQRVAALNPVLKEALGVSGDKVFILKRHLSHFRPERKAKYNQALRSEEIKQLPSVINNATTAYKDEKGFFIAFEDSLNAEKLNFIHFKADENGNFIITVKKVNANELSKHKSARVGVEPTTPKAENQPLPFTENKASLTDAANSSKNLAQSQVAETNIQKEAVRPLDAKIGKNNAEIRAVREQMAAKYPEETRELLKEEGITEIRGLIDSRWYNKILRTHPKDKLAQRFAELDKENERLGLLKANADSFTRKYKEELAKDIIELFRKEIGVKNDKESAVEYWVKKGFAPSTAEKEASKSLKLIADSRVEIETYLDIRPIAEFGTNYAEFYRDGTGAVKKLMAQKQGQVAGAFYREDLAKATGTGEIDLVWGDGTKGLRHILERKAADFEKQGLTKAQATQKALEFVENDLNNIITKGALELPRDKNGVLLQNPQKMFFHLDDKKSVIAVDYQGGRKWVLTAYFKSGDDTPRSAYPHKSKAHGDDFSTSSSAVSSSKILPQTAVKSQVAELEDDLMKRFEVFEKQAQNDKVDVDSWFEAQRKQGNKDVLEYDKDLEIYRNKTAKMQSQAKNQDEEASFKEQGLQWLKQNKSFFENKTDEELIALFKQSPEIKNAHEELDFIRKRLQEAFNIQPLKEFGTNYAEFYRDGAGAVKKLMAQKQGQVAGAFYRQELGDITLAWGEAGTGKSDGWGLAKIVKYHPEAVEKLEDVVKNGVYYLDQKGRPNVELNGILVGLRDNWRGEKTPYWVVSSYEKKGGELGKGIDSTKSASTSKEDYSFATHAANSSKIQPLSQAQAAQSHAEKYPLMAKYEKIRSDALDRSMQELADGTSSELRFFSPEERPKVMANAKIYLETKLPHPKKFEEHIRREIKVKKSIEEEIDALQGQIKDIDAKIASLEEEARKFSVVGDDLAKLKAQIRSEIDKALPLHAKVVYLERAKFEMDNLKHFYTKWGLLDEQVTKGSVENYNTIRLGKDYTRPRTGHLGTYEDAVGLLAQRRAELQEALNIQPLKEFGTNYAEFYRDGAGAVKKLMAEKQGQVAGAFYREELGDIDLVWGNEKIGLQKILNKHSDDFAGFKGSTQAEKLATALGEIVTQGKVVENAGVNTIIYSTGQNEFRIGLSKGFNGKGNNQWIITAYQRSHQAQNFDQVATKVQSGNNPPASGSGRILPQTGAKSQGEVVKTAIKEALKGPKKAPAVKHEGLKELEAVLKERLKEASGDVSFQRAQAREWRQTLESAQEAQKSSERLDHLKFRLAERIGDFRHAQRVRTDYEAKLRELGGVESSFKELSKKLSQLSKNPKPQDLSELYATKEGLLRVEGLLRGVEVRGNAAFNKLRSEVTQALEKSFDAINAAKKGLTPKAVEAAAPTRTQEFLDFTQDAKERVEWALGVSAEAAEKTIDELVKKSGGESARLKFLERLRASVKALGQESSEVVTPKTTEAVTPNLQKANLIKERLKNYKKD